MYPTKTITTSEFPLPFDTKVLLYFGFLSVTLSLFALEVLDLKGVAMLGQNHPLISTSSAKGTSNIKLISQSPSQTPMQHIGRIHE